VLPSLIENAGSDYGEVSPHFKSPYLVRKERKERLRSPYADKVENMELLGVKNKMNLKPMYLNRANFMRNSNQKKFHSSNEDFGEFYLD
jgi:hypothetical protein